MKYRKRKLLAPPKPQDDDGLVYYAGYYMTPEQVTAYSAGVMRHLPYDWRSDPDYDLRRQVKEKADAKKARSQDPKAT